MSRGKKYLLSIATGVVIIFIVVLAIGYKATYSGEPISTKDGVNFKSLPSGWTLHKFATGKFGVKNPTTVIANEELGCTATLGDIDPELFDKFYGSYLDPDTHYFYERRSGSIYIDANYYLRTTFVTRNQNGPDFQIYGVLISAFPDYSQTHGFMLFNQGKPIPEKCVRDFETIVTSIDLQDEPYIISKQSYGLISVDESYEDFVSDPGAKVRKMLVYQQPTGIKTVIAEVGSLTKAFGKTVYFIDKNRHFVSMDMFTKVKTDLGIPENVSDTNVLDYFVTESDFYYLLGKCDDMGECTSTLHHFDMSSHKDSILKKGASAGQIAGINGGEIYLTNGWGDAGCYAHTTHTFDLTTTEYKEYESFAGCDSSVVTELKKIRELIKDVRGNMVNLDNNERILAYGTDLRGPYIENEGL